MKTPLVPKVRNHFASLCVNYLETYHPEDYEKLRRLAEANYTEQGHKIASVGSVFRQFMIESDKSRKHALLNEINWDAEAEERI